MALHKLILIVLQLPNQIKQIFLTKPCGAETIFVKIALGTRLNYEKSINIKKYLTRSQKRKLESSKNNIRK